MRKRKRVWVFAAGLVSLCYLLLLASRAWSEEPKAGGSCVARVDVYQTGSKKTSFSKMFRYTARVRPNTRECSVVDWQLSWDYHRKDTGKLEKDVMLLATTVERGEGNATEEGEIQEDTNDTELNFRAENVSCRLCDAPTATKKQGPHEENEDQEVKVSANLQALDGTWITNQRTKCRAWVWGTSPSNNEAVSWSGACKNGLAQGHGVLMWGKDSRFEGNFRDGKRNGYGTETQDPPGIRFEGEWRDGRPNGHGVLTYPSDPHLGEIRFEGEWHDGCFWDGKRRANWSRAFEECKQGQ